MTPNRNVTALMATCGGWYLPKTANLFATRNALAGLWISDKNRVGIPADKYRRCWPFHLAMKPFYHLAPQILRERAFYALFPLWKFWANRQPLPLHNVIQAIMGYATELFDRTKTETLKVVDCPNSHPVSYFGFWQRECDIWCPGEKVPIPQWMFARMAHELQRADLILCPSTFVRDTMVANGLAGEKCFVNPFGVDTTIFRKRHRPPIRPRFICAGTICLRKGHQYLFRAFEQVKRKRPDAELICVGDYKTDFRRERPNWEGRFHHYSHTSPQGLATLLQDASAFVLASVEEGFARVLTEAMAAGLPVVATHETGAGTLVRNNVEGFLVPARQPEALAEAMLRVISTPQFNQQMGDAAYQRGADNNSWDDYGNRLLAEYQRRIRD